MITKTVGQKLSFIIFTIGIVIGVNNTVKAINYDIELNCDPIVNYTECDASKYSIYETKYVGYEIGVQGIIKQKTQNFGLNVQGYLSKKEGSPEDRTAMYGIYTRDIANIEIFLSKPFGISDNIIFNTKLGLQNHYEKLLRRDLSYSDIHTLMIIPDKVGKDLNGIGPLIGIGTKMKNFYLNARYSLREGGCESWSQYHSDLRGSVMYSLTESNLDFNVVYNDLKVIRVEIFSNLFYRKYLRNDPNIIYDCFFYSTLEFGLKLEKIIIKNICMNLVFSTIDPIDFSGDRIYKENEISTRIGFTARYNFSKSND